MPTNVSDKHGGPSHGEEHEEKEKRVQAFFILGLPGSGKTTVCRMIAPLVGCYHLSVGDYLRELILASPPPADEALGGLSVAELTNFVQSQTVVPPVQIVAILKQKLEIEKANGHSRFLIDGFPRTVESAELYDQEVGRPLGIIELRCAREIAETRFLSRKRAPGDSKGVFAERCEDYDERLYPLVARYSQLGLWTDVFPDANTPEYYRDTVLSAMNAFHPPVGWNFDDCFHEESERHVWRSTAGSRVWIFLNL